MCISDKTNNVSYRGMLIHEDEDQKKIIIVDFVERFDISYVRYLKGIECIAELGALIEWKKHVIVNTVQHWCG